MFKRAQALPPRNAENRQNEKPDQTNRRRCCDVRVSLTILSAESDNQPHSGPDSADYLWYPIQCTALPRLLLAFHNLPQFRRHFRNRLPTDLHRSFCTFASDQADFAKGVVLVRAIVAEVSPAAFFSLEG
jgi:hypothetical protein